MPSRALKNAGCKKETDRRRQAARARLSLLEQQNHWPKTLPHQLCIGHHTVNRIMYLAFLRCPQCFYTRRRYELQSTPPEIGPPFPTSLVAPLETRKPPRRTEVQPQAARHSRETCPLSNFSKMSFINRITYTDQTFVVTAVR
jgi:hypothetical protein